MQVEAKVDERRVEPRLDTSQGSVEIDGVVYPLRNWSRRGFLAGPYTGGHQEGDRIRISCAIPFSGKILELGGEALVIRVDGEGQELAALLVVKGNAWNEAFAQYFKARAPSS